MTWSRELQPCTPLTALYFDFGGFSVGSCNAWTRETSSARVEVGGRGNHMVRSSCISGLVDDKVMVEEEKEDSGGSGCVGLSSILRTPYVVQVLHGPDLAASITNQVVCREHRIGLPDVDSSFADRKPNKPPGLPGA